MRFRTLEKIKAEDNLARLFNAYIKGLSTINIFSTPHETMRECRHAFAREKRGRGKAKDSIRDSAQRFYELTIVGNALLGIHRSVIEGIALLQNFFTTYGEDLQRYAIERRIASINEFGSDEDSDWEWNGIGAKDEPDSWKVTYKDDPESLQYYTLYHDLGGSFHGHETRGEYIGTSGPEDFIVYSTLVKHDTDFSFRKMLAANGGPEIPLYRQREDGEFEQMSLADQIERELNEDIRNGRVVEFFDLVLALGLEVAEFYCTMDQVDLAHYRRLLQLLEAMRDVVPQH